MRKPDPYTAWIQKQRSCISGQFSEWVNGEGRSIACHVERVSRGSGKGIKAKKSLVPMTHAEHALQHQKGETALRPREWFENKADEYFARWELEKSNPLSRG